MIDAVSPEVDGGRFPIKRVVGEAVRVESVIFGDGHDRLAAVLRYRALEPGAVHPSGGARAEPDDRRSVEEPAGDPGWIESPLEAHVNDRWSGVFVVDQLGTYEYEIEAWVDDFATWRAGLVKKIDAGLDVQSELREGAERVRAAAERAAARGASEDADWLGAQARALREPSGDGTPIRVATSSRLAQRMALHPDRSHSSRSAPPRRVEVERERARTGAWYELFPRSCSPEPGRHGTLRDLEARLPYIADMGFDVVYLPPIHPIGTTARKGPNNTPAAGPGHPGSPWAIGSEQGGHKAVHPALGSLGDFDRVVARAGELGLEIALDIAFQCSPDHPYVKKHPEWFRHRPDGTIQYAENPPKKYQDIYPLDFECDAWRELWEELRSVVLFWVDHGVSIFRVDNPHTKPFAFWEWLIREVRREHPDAVFLSEAFTRPSVMQYLAKCGFSQSYTYFTWRNTRHELETYLTELTRTPVREYMRPNLFVNTPDILHEYLQTGRRAAFQARVTLAAMLAPSYGVYGPPFELGVSEAVPGTEEYRDSEKYQIRHWNLDDPWSLRPFIARLNEIRRHHAALTGGSPPVFHAVDNPQIIAFSRSVSGDPDDPAGAAAAAEPGDSILVVINLDPHHTQSGWLELPLESLGIDPAEPFQVHDLIGGGRYLWNGSRNFVMLDPESSAAHVFRIRKHLSTERDFDYFL